MSEHLSLAKLASAAGLSARQVRRRIAHGVIPPAFGQGKGRYFTTEHLTQLREIEREWREEKHRARLYTLPQIGEYRRHG